MLEQAKVTAGRVAGRPSLRCVAPKRKCSLKQPEWGLLSQEEALEARVPQLKGTSMVGGLKQTLPRSSRRKTLGSLKTSHTPVFGPLCSKTYNLNKLWGPGALLPASQQ